MVNQVSIRMAAINGNIQPRERYLVLTPDSPSIKVGRASKSVSKGLMGATENAWFDSPVMSRNHAEISLDAERDIVTIKDIGSMHGTFLNETQLPREEERSINSGDNIVFGVEVSRGIESFPACGFNLEYEFLPWKSPVPKTFAYPEVSDIEDDGNEEDYSEDEMDDMEEPLSENGVSNPQTPFKVPFAIQSIDLTQDESEVVPVNMRTGPDASCPALATSSPVLGRPFDVNLNKPKVRAQSTDHNNIIIEDSDSDISSIIECDSSSDEDDEDEQELSSECAPSEPLSVPLFSDIEDIGISQQAEMNYFPSPTLWPEEDPSISQSAPQKSHSSVRDRIEASEDILSDGDSSDDEDMDPIEEHDSTFSEVLVAVDNSQHRLDQEDLHVHKQMKIMESNFDDFPESAMRDTLLEPCLETPVSKRSAADILLHEFRSDKAALMESIPRLPSPSDAAMVKSSAQPSSAQAKETLSIIPVHHMTEQSWRQFAARSLGEKSGKHEFFEARENNRAQLEQEMHGEPGHKQSKPSDLFSARNLKHKIDADEISLPPYESFSSSRSQRCCINKAYAQDSDVAGSEVINDAKSTAAAETIPESTALQPVRSRVSIHDIIDDSIHDAKSPSLKRKADEISTVVEKEIEEWASSEHYLASEQSHQIAKSIIATSSVHADIEDASVLANPLAVTCVSDTRLHPEQRPAKRLRTFAERAGYVVLGGAGLFSLLVATAPDFL